MQHEAESFLVEMIRANNWANAVVLAACAPLSDDQLDSRVPGVYGTIRDTLLHMLWAEGDYVNRITGSRPLPSFRRDEKPPLSALAAYAELTGAALLDTVQRTPLDQIVREEEDGNFIEYQARLLFLQVINHGIEHRTNITTILNSLGFADIEVDGWGYLSAHPETFALKEGSA